VIRIRPAIPGDLPTICQWRREAATWLAEIGSDQWSDSGLSLDRFAARVRESIVAGETWMAEVRGVAVGTIALDHQADAGLWTPAELDELLIVHRMIRSRTCPVRGVGAALLAHADRLAAAAGRHALGLDAWDSNRSLHTYYLSLGFRLVRHVRGHDTPSATLFRREVTVPAANHAC
jgi:GNAT superfamily N-acetyltransferase